jgi:hypothetical protein
VCYPIRKFVFTRVTILQRKDKLPGSGRHLYLCKGDNYRKLGYVALTRLCAAAGGVVVVPPIQSPDHALIQVLHGELGRGEGERVGGRGIGRERLVGADQTDPVSVIHYNV